MYLLNAMSVQKTTTQVYAQPVQKACVNDHQVLAVALSCLLVFLKCFSL